MPEIRLATPEELPAIYKFRYAIAVGEMHWSESYADHEAQLITDELDGPKTMILWAWEGKTLIGISRSSFVRDGATGNYLDYYQLRRLPSAELEATSITTILMVHPRFRRTGVTTELNCEAYRRGLEQGIETNYCDCDPHLLPYYLKMGFTIAIKDFVHPEFGPGHVMKLDMYALDRLRAVKSPFSSVLAAHLAKKKKLLIE